MTGMTAIEQAAWVYEHRGEYDKQGSFDAVAALGEWGVFSSRHLQAITGVGHTTALRLAPKTARTGGAFSPDCLAPLLDIAQRRARGEAVEPEEVRDALSAGGRTSPGMAAKLTGIPESWIRRRLTRARQSG